MVFTEIMSSLSPFWSVPLPEAVAGQPLFDASGWLLGPSGPVSVEPVVVALLAVGFVGMSIKSVFDSILSDEGATDESEDSGDNGLMPEAGGEDLGGLGGFEDGDGDFGEFGDDEFGDIDGGADIDELEHQLDELETEVGSLSSTVNTVRNENEQISETVDDVEENVRKLLDIYEMVTRGVNPFADDIGAGGLGGPGDNSFGLFEDDEGGTDDELEDDIANADAEGFFDEDLVDDDDTFEADADVGDVLGEGDVQADDAASDDEFDEDFGDDAAIGMDEDFGEDSAGNGGDSEGGKSFAELKDEYESGEADWADDEGDAGEADDTEAQAPAESEDTDADDGHDSETVDGFADDDLFDTVIDGADEAVDSDENETSPDAIVETETASEAEDGADDESESEQPEYGEASDADTEPESDVSTEETAREPEDDSDTVSESGEGKPYLTELPDGFVADLIVVEWLEFLVEDVGVRATSEAIHYYERIDWIDEDVADQLQAYLKGFDADGGRATLTIDHHTRSLRYVSQLNGGGAASIALEQMPATAGGGSDGLQR